MKNGMEIKSPFSKAGMAVDEACQIKEFFLEKLADVSVRLKRNHYYFCQLEGHLYRSIMALKGIFCCVLVCLREHATVYWKDQMALLEIDYFIRAFSLRC